MSLIDMIRFDANGLVPAVIQDVENGQVLMVAYMNRGALEKTLATGITHFWSRSRQAYWMKGESSGHVQQVKEIYIDCDADCLLVKVVQQVAACHTGFRSCFYRKWDGKDLVTIGDKVFDADAVYRT
ncbi:MAG: phosphoribosyl-AMP cyclohydrolase [Desulfobacterota bacterium]|nr:phosphoribosyl-AMP cyclohydrolase [Thermodesulfobacteriota bacterium]